MVAVFIAHTGIQIGRETSGILSDRVVMNEDDIRRVVMGVPDVSGLPPHPHARLGGPHVPRSARLVPRRHDALRSAPPVARREGSADGAATRTSPTPIIHIEPPPPCEDRDQCCRPSRICSALRSHIQRRVECFVPSSAPRPPCASPSASASARRTRSRTRRRQERDLLDALELRELAVEGVDDLLIEREHVGPRDELGARRRRAAEILQPALERGEVRAR